MHFTKEEINFIRTNASTMTAAQIGAAINRSKKSVHNKAHELGISMRKFGDNHYRMKHTQHDLELCRALFDDGMSLDEISEKMEISKPYVSNIVHFHKRKTI